MLVFGSFVLLVRVLCFATCIPPLSVASATVLSFACKTEVLGALVANMFIVEIVVEDLQVSKKESAALPKTLVLAEEHSDCLL